MDTTLVFIIILMLAVAVAFLGGVTYATTRLVKIIKEVARMIKRDRDENE